MLSFKKFTHALHSSLWITGRKETRDGKESLHHTHTHRNRVRRRNAGEEGSERETIERTVHPLLSWIRSSLSLSLSLSFPSLHPAPVRSLTHFLISRVTSCGQLFPSTHRLTQREADSFPFGVKRRFPPRREDIPRGFPSHTQLSQAHSSRHGETHSIALKVYGGGPVTGRS